MASVLGNIFFCIVCAFLLSIVMIALLLLLVHLVYPAYLRNALLSTFILISPLFVLLSVQSFLLFGAISVNRDVSSVKELIEADTCAEVVGNAVPVDSYARLAQELGERYPFLGDCVLSVEGVEENAGVYVAVIQDEISWYIVRRVLWGMGFLVLVGALIFYKAGKEQRRLDYLRYRNLINL